MYFFKCSTSKVRSILQCCNKDVYITISSDPCPGWVFCLPPSLSLSASCACSSVDSSVAPLSWNYSPLQITKCCYTIQRTLLFQINTLHNTKRLGPFLGFGCNFGEKQNKCLKTDPKSVCLMWFVQVFCLFASWANPNCISKCTARLHERPSAIFCQAQVRLKVRWR